MNIILKHHLYKELKKYTGNKKDAKKRYKELLSIIYNNSELEHVIKYYTTINAVYNK